MAPEGRGARPSRGVTAPVRLLLGPATGRSRRLRCEAAPYSPTTARATPGRGSEPTTRSRRRNAGRPMSGVDPFDRVACALVLETGLGERQVVGGRGGGAV